MSISTYLLEAAAVADATGLLAAPGAVLVQHSVPSGGAPATLLLLAAGRLEDVRVHPSAATAARSSYPNAVIIPGLVNAHTHLDLTHIGPVSYDPDQGFSGWAGTILSQRLHEPEPLLQSVADGIERSLRGGVVAVGDIAGDWHLEPVRALQASPLLGTSYIEFFGMGLRQEAVLERLLTTLAQAEPLRNHSRVRVGLQPHATYTVGSRLMAWTSTQRRHDWPISTHLAENPPEQQFIAQGTGPFRNLLERLNFWDATILDDVAKGRRPIEHFHHAMHAVPWLLAHVNDCDDRELAMLARAGASVAYCPRSSDYFLNHRAFGPHRYREMIDAGINVALGTDSIVNLPGSDLSRLSTLDEIRFLWNRDRTDPGLLLRMATINGARALGLDPALFTLHAAPRHIAGLAVVSVQGTDPAIHPLERVARSRGGVQSLFTQAIAPQTFTD